MAKRESDEVLRRRGSRSPRLREVDRRSKPRAWPEPTTQLGPHGNDVWEALWSEGDHLVPSDAQGLTVVCELFDERAILQAQWQSDPSDWRVKIALDRVSAALLKGLGDFGFTASARTRMGIRDPEPDQPDALDEFLAEKAVHVASRETYLAEHGSLEGWSSKWGEEHRAELLRGDEP